MSKSDKNVNRRFGIIPLDLAINCKNIICLKTYIALSCCQGKKLSCWPSRETISKMIGIDIQSVSEAISWLKVTGWIDVKRRKWDTSIYTVLKCPKRGYPQNVHIRKKHISLKSIYPQNPRQDVYAVPSVDVYDGIHTKTTIKTTKENIINSAGAKAPAVTASYIDFPDSPPSQKPEPATRRPKAESVKKPVDPLFHKIEQAFLSKQQYTNFGKEGKAINLLIVKAKLTNPDDPELEIKNYMEQFYELTQGRDHFWQKPFIPSMLCAMWDHVTSEIRKRAPPDDDESWDQFEQEDKANES